MEHPLQADMDQAVKECWADPDTSAIQVYIGEADREPFNCWIRIASRSAKSAGTLLERAFNLLTANRETYIRHPQTVTADYRFDTQTTYYFGDASFAVYNRKGPHKIMAPEMGVEISGFGK